MTLGRQKRLRYRSEVRLGQRNRRSRLLCRFGNLEARLDYLASRRRRSTSRRYRSSCLRLHQQPKSELRLFFCVQLANFICSNLSQIKGIHTQYKSLGGAYTFFLINYYPFMSKIDSLDYNQLSRFIDPYCKIRP